MPAVLTAAREFRADLHGTLNGASDVMLRAWAGAWRRTDADFRRLGALVRHAKATMQIPGEDTPANRRLIVRWLNKQARMAELMAHMEQELLQLARVAHEETVRAQAEAIASAQSHAYQLTLEGLSPAINEPTAAARVAWNRVPQEALENLVGYLGDGTPLDRVLRGMAPVAVQEARGVLSDGFARGVNPRVIGKELRQVVGSTLARATLIARTETMRAYRQASVESYRANDDVVAQWRWTASLSGRTCAACLAMHGTLHPLDEEFGSHPACRCSPTPLTRSWAELGFDVEEPAQRPWQTGDEWLQGQDEATRVKVLGKRGAAAYDAGQVTLRDFVGKRTDPDWGVVRWQVPLIEAKIHALRRMRGASE